MKTSFPLQAFPLLTNYEGHYEAREIDALRRADVYARQMLLVGPLRASTEAVARLDMALQQLAPWPTEMPDDASAAAVDGAHWAYRIGLIAGMRLAQATADDLPAIEARSSQQEIGQ